MISYEQFSLTLIVQIVRKILIVLCYKWKYKTDKKIVEFSKISIKMKNCKTFYKTQTAATLRKLFRLPPNPLIRLNLTTSLEQTFSYGDIQKYTDICLQSASIMQLLSVKYSANVFCDTKQKHVCWKTCKVKKVSAGFETFC